MSVKASPRTWTVDDNGPANFDNIQEAINNASSGDTVFVHIGTYYEHVVINKTIALVGEDNNFTIIDGYETGNVIYIRANNVTVKSFTVRKSGMYPYSAILIDHSTGNVIINNKVIYNYEGISLYYSSSNVVCGNTILSNYPGIDLALLSSYNIIYHNNFNNTDQVWSESTNVWNYDDEGNYWSDYTGQDLNKDGIGDTSYDINAANKDNNPLMGMFFNFSAALEREAYSVTVISNSTISGFRFQIGAETGNKMIHFNATGEDGTLGFCRVKMPTRLMNYPYIVLVDSDEIIPTLLNVSNEAYTYLYFTYLHTNHSITIISSKTLALYFELLAEYLKLQEDLYDFNKTYYTLLENYNILLSNYTQLQISFGELNDSYQMLSGLNETYYELLDNYLELQRGLHDLNETYVKHLLDYSEQMQNIRNLTYILVALATILIITTIYLSKRSHTNVTTRIKAIEEK